MSGLCGKFGNNLFTATVVRARRKNAGIAGPTSNPSLINEGNATMAAVASIRVAELSKQPTSSLPCVLCVVPESQNLRPCAKAENCF